MYKMCNDMHPLIVNIMYIQNETIPDFDTRQGYHLHVAIGLLLYHKINKLNCFHRVIVW